MHFMEIVNIYPLFFSLYFINNLKIIGNFAQ